MQGEILHKSYKKFPIRPCFVKYELHLYEKYAKIYTSCSGKRLSGPGLKRNENPIRITPESQEFNSWLFGMCKSVQTALNCFCKVN